MAAASVVWGVSVHPHGEQLESCTLFCKLFLLPASCSLAFTISTTVYSSCIGPVLTAAACCFECCSLLFTKLLRLLYSTRLQRHGQAQKHAQAGRSKSSQVTVQLYSSRTAVLRTYSCTAVQLYGRTRTLNTARALVHCAGWALIGRRVSFFIWPHSHSSLCAGRND
jgi:hypothetical protein